MLGGDAHERAVTQRCAASAGSTALTPGQFRAAVVAMMITILLSALDQTIVSVVVPTIAHQLGGFQWMAWVVSGYLVAATVVTPLYGRLSDLVGRRRVISAAILIFVLASVACALANSMPALVVARVLQGAGGGGLIATAQSVIADIVPARDRGRYQSYVSIVWAVASVLGPVAGGLLTQYLSWPWIFWINVPVGAVALGLVRSSLRSSEVSHSGAGVDGVGAVLLLAGLTALLVPITRIGQGALWSDPLNLIVTALAFVLLIAFVAQQRRHEHPIVPLALLANRTVVAVCALLFLCFFNFVALSVLIPMRLQLIEGFSAADAGLWLLPLTLAIPVAAFCSGHWLSLTGRALPLQRAGVTMVSLGLFTLGYCPPSGWMAVLGLLTMGVGMGCQMPTTLIMAQQAVNTDQIGMATAMTAFFRQLGGAVGIAVLSSVVLLRLGGSPTQGAGAGGDGSLGRLFDSALGGAGGPNLNDGAFALALRLAAWASLAGWWLVRGLPELHRHDQPVETAPAVGAATSPP